MFKVLHQSVARKSQLFYDVLRRYNYVTPTSYLELLQTFKVCVCVSLMCVPSCCVSPCVRRAC